MLRGIPSMKKSFPAQTHPIIEPGRALSSKGRALSLPHPLDSRSSAAAPLSSRSPPAASPPRSRQRPRCRPCPPLSSHSSPAPSPPRSRQRPRCRPQRLRPKRFFRLLVKQVGMALLDRIPHSSLKNQCRIAQTSSPLFLVAFSTRREIKKLCDSASPWLDLSSPT